MKKPIVRCPKCNGGGWVELKPHLAETLKALGKRAMTAGELRESGLNGVTINAISNRLADLFALHLVTRTQRGKFWVYSRVPAEKPKAGYEVLKRGICG